MDIELNRLSANETPVRGEVRIGDPDGSLAAEGLSFPEPWRIDATARRTEGGVAVVRGRVTGSVQLECGRCVARFPFPVDVEFESRYAEAHAAPEPTRSRHAGDEDDGHELADADLDVSFLPVGIHVIQVGDIVREQALLQVPLRPLCRPDCAGLCQRCGADLNAADCGCPEDLAATTDVRLLALAALKKKEPGSTGQ